MKYIVEVNAKYLVSVEADCPADAEFIMFDLENVWGALAFDQKMMKTDTFAGAVLGCETISMQELRDKDIKAIHAKNLWNDAQASVKAKEEEINEMRKALEAAETELEELKNAQYKAQYDMERAINDIGKKRD